jgi:hypothetical protein
MQFEEGRTRFCAASRLGGRGLDVETWETASEEQWVSKTFSPLADHFPLRAHNGRMNSHSLRLVTLYQPCARSVPPAAPLPLGEATFRTYHRF